MRKSSIHISINCILTFSLLIFFTFKTFSQIDSTTNNVIAIKEDVCADVEVETDKFTEEVSYNSPDIQNITFIKYKSKVATKQYVSISTYDTYLSGHNNKGLIILFKSGKKINRANEQIDVHNSSGSNWRYSAFFTPTTIEINLLKSEEIIGVKLYIFNADISAGSLIKDYANCVLVNPKPKAPVKKNK